MLENLDRQYPTNPGVSSRAVDDHVRMIAAMRARDAAQAEALMLEHMRDLEGRFTRIQDEMRRRRAARTRSIRPWGGVRLASDAASGGGA
jgi:DNA-binding GntR family transcriptional regulator